MTKKEIEYKFRRMLLKESTSMDLWHIHTITPTKYLWSFSIVQMPGRKNDGYMIQIKGGPISLQGWYMPDAGIERIQKIIQEIIRL